MNRTARLYALVEELRAAAPRAVTVGVLATRFEVSVRTVQRDLQALMHSGVPVRAVTGRGGGWAIDPRTTLPPIRLTADEASAVTAALAAVDEATPYAGAARTAAQKIAATLTGPGSEAARDLAARIVALRPSHDGSVRTAVERSLAEQLVLRLTYTDAAGEESRRDVEPAGLLTAGRHWYLIAWCRSRRAGRGFRLDRIKKAVPIDEPAGAHDLSALLRGSAGAGADRPDALSELATAAPTGTRRTTTSPRPGGAPAS
ncbi:helix-turn-helix transcriptional regulator [Streptomyces sp. SDT5-1]|uniref:helix-turn-helix transcriptional regulator n=1 Tax=Streptomyces sp. SDT5-1 TaxID=3406418 RepID=UPI003FD6BBDE